MKYSRSTVSTQFCVKLNVMKKWPDYVELFSMKNVVGEFIFF